MRVHSSCETSAHKTTWSVHKCSFQKCFLHIFHTRRSKYRRVLVKCCTKEIVCAHRLWKIWGNIAPVWFIRGSFCLTEKTLISISSSVTDYSSCITSELWVEWSHDCIINIEKCSTYERYQLMKWVIVVQPQAHISLFYLLVKHSWTEPRLLFIYLTNAA